MIKCLFGLLKEGHHIPRRQLAHNHLALRPGADDEEVGVVGLPNNVIGRTAAKQHITKTGAERQAEGFLDLRVARIDINQQDPAPGLGQRRSQIARQRGLSIAPAGADHQAGVELGRPFRRVDDPGEDAAELVRRRRLRLSGGLQQAAVVARGRLFQAGMRHGGQHRQAHRAEIVADLPV
ncbi:MAG TPA: hypothetical protein PLD73_05915, partial [Candidatus Hydrogenedentes bacterium]|nr:hypothetical protein [Candidatus Hydrogenedentota bacterium]